jgi:hypothetical protein
MKNSNYLLKRNTLRTPFACWLSANTVFLLGALAVAAEPAPSGAGAARTEQSATAGVIAGRVKSATSGVYLRNARVAVEGTVIETLTNESGEFLIPSLPAGNYRLHATYTGMTPGVAAVSTAEAAGSVEIVLQEFGQSTAGPVVKLDAFTVSTRREMSAADMAINEKRVARNIKEVISTDAFGTLAQDNLGDFLQYLPGVEVEGDGTAPLTVGLRGMPAEYTNIEMDGAGLSIPQTSGSTHVVALRGLTMSNVDRIEVTKGPTPDTGADSIGGRINMISPLILRAQSPRISLPHLSADELRVSLAAQDARWQRRWGRQILQVVPRLRGQLCKSREQTVRLRLERIAQRLLHFFPPTAAHL